MINFKTLFNNFPLTTQSACDIELEILFFKSLKIKPENDCTKKNVVFLSIIYNLLFIIFH